MKPALIILAIALLASPSSAQTARPTSDIAALIADAAPGDRVLVPAGLYAGTLVVDRPIVLDGAGRVEIDGLGADAVVVLISEGVTFRGFTVRNTASGIDREPAAIRAETGPVVIEDNIVEDALFGIDLRTAPGSVVRRNRVSGKPLGPERRGDAIRLWWSADSVVEDNDVSDSRDVVFWYSEGMSVARNRVRGSRYGLHFMYSHDTTLRDNTLTANSVGVYLMYSKGITLEGNTIVNNRGASGYGIGLKDCDAIVIEHNALLANRVGLYIDNSPSSIDSTGSVRGNLIAYNQAGVVATPNTHDNVFTGNVFLDNEEQVSVHGRGSLTLNRFSEGGVGNFWSDYAGFDADNDGVGDLAYEPRSLFESLLAREPNLRILQHSPAQQTVEFTARMLPEVRPEPKLIDEHPLARPPQLEFGDPEDPRARGPMFALGVSLFAIACGVALWLARDNAALGTQGRVSA